MLLPLLLITSCFSVDEQAGPEALQEQMDAPTALDIALHAFAPDAPPLTRDETLTEYTLPRCIDCSCFCCDYSGPTRFSLFRSTRRESRLLNSAMQAMTHNARGPGIDSCALCEGLHDELQEHYCRAQKMPAGRPESDHPKICRSCKDNHCVCPFCAGPKFKKLIEQQPQQQTMSGAENAQPLLRQENLPPLTKYCFKPCCKCCTNSAKAVGLCGVEVGNGVMRTAEWCPYCFWKPFNGCCLMLGNCGACISKACGRCTACVSRRCRACGKCIGRCCSGCRQCIADECNASCGVSSEQCGECCRSICRRMQLRSYNAHEIQRTPARDPPVNGAAD